MPTLGRGSRLAGGLHAPRFALTGTPGTGKSTVASRLARRGFGVVHLADELLKRGRLPRAGKPPFEVDPRVLRRMRIETGVVEGHLSHFLPARAVIVLRCSPKEVERRLRARGEPPAKARENAEAEAIAVVAGEARREHRTVFEVDTTSRSPTKVARDLMLILAGHGARFRRRIDHVEGVLAWY